MQGSKAQHLSHSTSSPVNTLPRSPQGDLLIPPSLAAGLLPRGSLHVVAFADEEGVRFQSTFLGSRAVVGGEETRETRGTA